MMMKLHFIFLIYNPYSILQVFHKPDKISNLKLSPSEDLLVKYSTPSYDVSPTFFKERLRPSNIREYYTYSILQRPKGTFRDVTFSQKYDTHRRVYLNKCSQPFGLLTRERMLLHSRTDTTMFDTCNNIRKGSILILTACRIDVEVMTTQIYLKIPSVQQVTQKLRQITLQETHKKRLRQQKKNK